MNSGRNMRAARQGRLVRAIALFFLVYTFADTVCPQYCCEEALGMRTAAASAPSTSLMRDVVPSMSASSGDPYQDRNSGAVPGDEDCFCRSSVVISTDQQVNTSAPLSDSLVSEPKGVFIPNPPARSLFHPPRAS